MTVEPFIRKRGEALFFIYMIIGVVPLFLYETILNEAFIWAFTYLSVPILIACFWVYLYKVPGWRKTTGPTKGALWTLLIASMLVLISGGHVMWANASIGPQRDFIIEGRVARLDTYRSAKAGISYYVYVEQHSTGAMLKLDITKSHYDGLKTGDKFSETWKVGSLGLVYKTK